MEIKTKSKILKKLLTFAGFKLTDAFYTVDLRKTWYVLSNEK